MSTRTEILASLSQRYAGLDVEEMDHRLRVSLASAALPDFAVALTTEYGCEFASLSITESITEPITGSVSASPEGNSNTEIVARYFFYTRAAPPESPDGVLLEIVIRVTDNRLPAISDRVHAADWPEREAEDLFGVQFEGHPFLGDFVLHDTDFPENIRPMRHAFDPNQRVDQQGLGADWKPRRILDEIGALAFPVGPIWGDYHEAGLWLLETPGEQIRQAQSRLFYKYRGVEKSAEHQPPSHGLMLAERFSGSSAVAHATAYCQALESISACVVPERAQLLRIVFAEFERIRYHAASIAELAGSTGLAVGKAMAQEVEEALLRLGGDVCGHRYLFGLIKPGGLAWQPDDNALDRLGRRLIQILARLNQLEKWLVASSSFLDRIEEMGVLTPALATTYGTVGPVARGSGRQLDLRRHLPYGEYRRVPFDPPCEIEGDGYARMRVFFAEIRVSGRLLASCLETLPAGPVTVRCEVRAGAAPGWVEAPTGGAFHWLEIGEDGDILRWSIRTAGFRNWHAFHRAIEGAAFQDFPIILASFGLSIAENDR